MSLGTTFNLGMKLGKLIESILIDTVLSPLKRGANEITYFPFCVP